MSCLNIKKISLDNVVFDSSNRIEFLNLVNYIKPTKIHLKSCGCRTFLNSDLNFELTDLKELIIDKNSTQIVSLTERIIECSPNLESVILSNLEPIVLEYFFNKVTRFQKN